MTLTQRQIEEWLHRNSEEFILCPFQPGNLRITRSGCSKRRMRAKAEEFMDFSRYDFFTFAYKSGLLLCRNCRIAEPFSCGEGYVEQHLRQTDLISMSETDPIKPIKEMVNHEEGVQGDLEVLENSMGILHEVDDGPTRARGGDAGNDTEKRRLGGRIGKDD